MDLEKEKAEKEHKDEQVFSWKKKKANYSIDQFFLKKKKVA